MKPQTIEAPAGETPVIVSAAPADAAPADAVPTDEAPAGPSAGEARSRILAPYVTQLALDPVTSDAPAVKSSVRLGEIRLALDAWELTALESGLAQTEADGWQSIVAEGVAFQGLCVSLLGPAERPTSEGIIHLQAAVDKLVGDAAAGIAVLEELQRVIDQWIVAGEIAEAKKLTSFRNKIGASVTRIRERITKDAFGQAEERSKEMIGPPPEVVISKSVGPVTMPIYTPKSLPVAKIVVHDPAGMKAEPNTLKPLLLFLASLIAIWFIFILPRFERHAPPVLEMESFGTVQGVQTITARPPSLFANVDAAEWNRMSRQERSDAIVRLAEIAGGAGYMGVQLRTDNGTTVARWLEQTGVKVFDSKKARGSAAKTR